MLAQMRQVLGSGGEESGEVIGMDMTGFMMDMPLLALLSFQEGALPMPAEDIVDGLLAQAHQAEGEATGRGE